MNVDSKGLLIYVALLGAASVVASFYLPRLWRATPQGTFIVVWLAIVSAFAGYGFCGPGMAYQYIDGPFSLRTALAPAVTYGAIGVCIATCVVVGLILVIGVRAHGASKGYAILILVLSSVASVILPPLILICSGLFHGEGAMLIRGQAVIFLGITVVSFIVFGSAILCIPKH